MIAFKRILVPVDFSEASKKAITYGLTLADQFNSKLILAHIVPESSALAYAFPTETFDMEKEQVEKAQSAIKDLVPPEYAARQHIQEIVRTGNIEAELLAIVENEGADLVVMGTHGRRRLGRWFLGSVTEHMLRKVPVPVLTVSHVDTEKHQVGMVSLKRILYATDLSEYSNAGLKYAVEIARAAGSSLSVMHAIHYPDRRLWAAGGIPGLESERAADVQEMRKRLADVLAQEAPQEMQVEMLVVEGRPSEKILEIAGERAMDIIVLNLQSKSTLERTLIGITAERVVRLAPIPVLSVPPAGKR